MPRRCAQLLHHPFCRTQLCLNLFKNRSNWTNRVTERKTGATVWFTPTWLSLITAFVKQYSSPVCPGPYQENSCLERAIKVRAARQVYCPQQRHYFLRDSWTVDTVLFYDSSCPTFQWVLESSCLQFCLPRNCCLKFFQLSFPWIYISN